MSNLPREELYERLDITYEYGRVRDQLSFIEKIALDTWYKNSLLLDENIEDDDCFVSKSLIEDAGEGLFANRDFSKGETITEYPTNNIFIDGTLISFVKGKCIKMPLDDKDPMYADWKNCIKKGRVMCYNIDTLPKNQRFKGFKVNDLDFIKDITKEEYVESKLSNCMFDDMFNIVAKRDIKKGEEIYVKYGEYWNSHFNQTTP